MVPTVRRAHHNDVHALPDIERAAATVFLELPELAWLAEGAVTPVDEHLAYVASGTLWVADRGVLVGFLAAERVEGELHIHELSVRPEWQGRGLGRRLVEAALATARADGLAAATLTTFRDVPWNGPYYERLGFRFVDDPVDRLAELLRAEIARGLPGERRCAMRLVF